MTLGIVATGLYFCLVLIWWLGDQYVEHKEFSRKLEEMEQKHNKQMDELHKSILEDVIPKIKEILSNKTNKP